MRPTSLSRSILAAGLLSAGLLAGCAADVPASRPMPVVGNSDKPLDMSAMVSSPGTFDFTTVGALSIFDQASGQASLSSALGDINAAGTGVDANPGLAKITIPGQSCPTLSVGDNVFALLVGTMPDPLVVWADFGNTPCDTSGGGTGPWTSGTLVTALYGLSTVVNANTILTGNLTNGSLANSSLTLAADFFDLTNFTTDPSTPGTTGPRVDGGLDVSITVDGSGTPSNGRVQTDVYIRFDTYASGTGSVTNTVIVSNMDITASNTPVPALTGALRYATPADGFVDVILTGVERDSTVCAAGEPTAGTVTFANGVDTVVLNFNGTTSGTCGQAAVTVNGLGPAPIPVGKL
ncbi:MAG: hypothetical protein OEY97_07125 [Nitrospirota bacterium]|nr:hypothetical protein [Nitrospirota bacterium]